MRRTRANPKRATLVVCIAVAGALVPAGAAHGAGATIVAQANVTFNAASYSTDQGDVATLQVAGGTHNVTATQNGPDGKALFRSNTISGGSTPVDGTQYLTAGSYAFICSIHPTTMQATLNVSSNGTPLARPALSLKLVSTSLDKVAKKGVLLVRVTTPAPGQDAAIEAGLGKSSLAKATGLSLVSGAQKVKLKLGKKAKSKLASRSKATIALKGTVPFGSPGSATGKLR